MEHGAGQAILGGHGLHARMRLLGRRASLLLAVAAATSVGAGCGGDDPKGLLDAAFSRPIPSADVSLDLKIEVQGVERLQGPIRLQIQGPYRTGGDRKIPSVDFDVSASAGGRGLAGGIVSTGDNAYVRFQDTNYEVGEDAVAAVNRQIAESKRQGGGRSLKEFGIDPRSWIKDAEEKGDEEVAGVETTRISAGLDVGKLLADLNEFVDKAGGTLGGQAPPKLTDLQRRQVEQVVRDPTFDVFVGKDDKRIRRLTAQLRFAIPEGRREAAGGIEGGTVSFSIEFANVGGDQRIEAPADARPISDLRGQIQALGLGALGGNAGDEGGASGSGGAGSGSEGASSGSGGAGSGSGPASEAESGGAPAQDGEDARSDVQRFEDYSRCIDEADSTDANALRRCSELLE